MASLAELIALSKYQSGDIGNGKQADYASAMPTGSFNPDRQQAVALKLLQYKAQVEKEQAEAAIATRKKQIWDDIGNPVTSDKSTAGDVAGIVDTEKVGGKDANVVNRGEALIDGTDDSSAAAMRGSNSKLVNMLGGMQPKMSSAGNLILSKQKAKSNYQGTDKKYDEAKTFSYAKRLAEQDLISAGKSKTQIGPEDFAAMVKAKIPNAETHLYGKPLSQATEEAAPVDTAAPAVKDNKLPDAPTVQYQEGQTAINPKTNKRLVFKGGKWQSVN